MSRKFSEGKPETIDSLLRINKLSHAIKKFSKTSAKKQLTKVDDPTFTEEQEVRLLKQFDLNADYGPCSGLSRMERWKRAEKFGFNPPSEVHDLVVSHSKDDSYTQCIWYGVKI